MEVDTIPRKGETVVAQRDPLVGGGGKGCNQAVACARLAAGRADVAFVGRVGADAAGDALLAALAEAGVDVAGVERCAGASGQGFVVVEAGGAVLSVVAAGANFRGWDSTACDDAWADGVVAGARVVLLQREVPEFVNEAVARAAERAGVTVLQDAGGEDRPVADAHLARCDYLAPNLTELGRLAGAALGPGSDAAAVDAAARKLVERGARRVLATLGARGCRLLTGAGVQAADAVPGVVAVDETGAGDAFRAAFAVALSEGAGEAEALEAASAAGAAAVAATGALSSLPTRATRDAVLARLRGGADRRGGGVGSACPWRFASRLNSMKDRRDLADGPNDTLGWVARQGRIEGLDLVDFNYPEHLEGLEAEDVAAALQRADLACGAVCLRYPADVFRKGSLTHPDAAVRRAGVRLTVEACDWARKLGATEVCVWSAWDGYDYSLQSDYDALWTRLVEGFRAVCDAAPDIRVSLEFKPTDENTRFFAVPSTGAALVLCMDVDRPNFGLTLDVGHCLAAGENPAQAVAMVARRRKLFGVQLNDGYQRIGAEDGLIFGSVHPLMAREFVYWLRRSYFQGHVYFDTFPRNEDPVRECEMNIRQVKRFYDLAADLEAEGLLPLLVAHDALAVLEKLEKKGEL